MDTSEDIELSQRLGLYQVFLKLYEHHRGLLDEILELENAGSKSLAEVRLPYLQGVIKDQQVHLVTNLLSGRTQALMQPEKIWTIGRDSRNVGLPIQDKRLSRCHAAIRYIDQQGFYLIDLESSNGSFVNGERIRQAYRLKDGDRLRMGSLTIAFFLCSQYEELEQLAPETLSRIGQTEHSGADMVRSKAEAPPPTPSDRRGEECLPPDKTLLLPRSNLWTGKPMMLPPED